jgi:integrase
MRLTDELLRKRERPKSGQTFDWDDLVAGFGVRYTPQSTSFVVQWREPSGKKPRESLRPRWPQLTVSNARELARKRLAEVVALKEGGGLLEFRLAIRSWYDRKTEIAVWGPRYRSKVDSMIRLYIEGIDNPRVKLTPSVRAAIAELGNKPVGSVRRSDVMRVADGIKRGTAEQFMAIGSSFYNDMIERDVEIPNPFKNRLRVTGGRRVRRRAFTDSEFLTLWRAFNKEGDPALGAFTLLAFTGARRREVTRMPHAELDLESATWTLPPERRKNGRKDPHPFAVYLHPFVIETLRRQPRLEGSPFVFWGRRDKAAFDFHSALMTRLHALGLAEWRLHDLRRYMRSGLGRLGVPQTVAEMCLGHIAKPGLVGVYDQYTYEKEKREAWMKWGDHLTALCGLHGNNSAN